MPATLAERRRGCGNIRHVEGETDGAGDALASLDGVGMRGVGRVEQLPRKGSYFTKELAVARTSVVIVP